jgi:hypothetical protein
MKSTTKSVSLTSRDRSFVLSASSNGVFIDLFSINGWLLQIFAVQILITHKSLVDSLVLAYPVVMVLELCALALVSYVDYRKLLFVSFGIRSLLVVAMPAYLGTLPQLVPFFYYTAFFFHIAGFHVCWPLFVKDQIPAHRRGHILGLARAYTNIVSLSALFLIFVAGKFAQDLAALVGLAATVLASCLALTGISQQRDHSQVADSPCRQGRDGSVPRLRNFLASLHRLAADRSFRKVAIQTLSLGVATLPLPLLFLPQSGLIGNSNIVLAFIIGTAISILVFPAFGKLMDRSQTKAYSLVLATGLASMLAIAAVLILRDVLSSHIVLAGAFLGIASNFVTVRLAGLFSYKRALEVGESELTATSAVTIAWVFDLAAWSVVAAMQFLPGIEPTGRVYQNYVLICLASAAVSIMCFFFARQQQIAQHA